MGTCKECKYSSYEDADCEGYCRPLLSQSTYVYICENPKNLEDGDDYIEIDGEDTCEHFKQKEEEKG
jgi:hypothetical protein